MEQECGVQSQLAARAELSVRLAARRSEIELATVTRIHAISDRAGVGDAVYRDGLRAAVSVALGHGIAVIESSANFIPDIPIALGAQARLAARSGVSLETVLRRYFAGYVIFGDYLVGEARGLFDDAGLKPVLRSQATAFDRLLDAVSDEYTRELRSRPSTAELRRAARIERLLNGELLDTSDLGYRFEGCHLGLVAAGRGASQAIRQISIDLDSRLLLANRNEDMAWAWLGQRLPLDAKEIQCHFAQAWPKDLSLAIGAPGEGVAGWRFSHRQACAALPVAQRGSEPVVSYADVALLAAALRDEVLGESLNRIFMMPLARDRHGGATQRETLRAYFAASRNTSSAAVALGVSRQTVNSRLRAVEERIGYPLDSCASQLQTALGLQDLGGSGAATAT